MAGVTGPKSSPSHRAPVTSRFYQSLSRYSELEVNPRFSSIENDLCCIASDQSPKYDKINRCHPHYGLIRRRLHRHSLQFFVKPTILIISRESEKLKIFSMPGVECS